MNATTERILGRGSLDPVGYSNPVLEKAMGFSGVARADTTVE